MTASWRWFTTVATIGATAVLLALAAIRLIALPNDLPGEAPVPDVAAADNAFGFRLLNTVQKTSTPNSNIVLSPVSAAVDLSMALNGASAATADEMKAVLSLQGLDLVRINKGNAQLIRSLRSPINGVTLSIANAIFVDNRRSNLSLEFAKRTREWYDAKVSALDFSDPNTLGLINDWAAQQTNNRIPRVLDAISRDDVAFLLNAVYFKSTWQYRFDERNTRLNEFTLANGGITQVSRMSQSGSFDYFQTPEIQAIRLPYSGGQFAMYVFLPSKSSSLTAFASKLTPENWKIWNAKFSRQQGTIEMPRYELKNSYWLNDALQAMGMRRAFNPRQAEFANMGSGQLNISFVKQDTFLKVNEEGSEAAAVTNVGMRVSAVFVHEYPVPFTMIVDRPFFCAIEDTRSQLLLFVGAIYDPRS